MHTTGLTGPPHSLTYYILIRRPCWWRCLRGRYVGGAWQLIGSLEAALMAASPLSRPCPNIQLVLPHWTLLRRLSTPPGWSNSESMERWERRSASLQKEISVPMVCIIRLSPNGDSQSTHCHLPWNSSAARPSATKTCGRSNQKRHIAISICPPSSDSPRAGIESPSSAVSRASLSPMALHFTSLRDPLRLEILAGKGTSIFTPTSWAPPRSNICLEMPWRRFYRIIQTSAMWWIPTSCRILTGGPSSQSFATSAALPSRPTICTIQPKWMGRIFSC